MEVIEIIRKFEKVSTLELGIIEVVNKQFDKHHNLTDEEYLIALKIIGGQIVEAIGGELYT